MGRSWRWSRAGGWYTRGCSNHVEPPLPTTVGGHVHAGRARNSGTPAPPRFRGSTDERAAAGIVRPTGGVAVALAGASGGARNRRMAHRNGDVVGRGIPRNTGSQGDSSTTRGSMQGGPTLLPPVHLGTLST